MGKLTLWLFTPLSIHPTIQTLNDWFEHAQICYQAPSPPLWVGNNYLNKLRLSCTKLGFWIEIWYSIGIGYWYCSVVFVQNPILFQCIINSNIETIRSKKTSSRTILVWPQLLCQGYALLYLCDDQEIFEFQMQR